MELNEIRCILHKNSYFVEGNINNISIEQEMCLIFNKIYDLKIKFTESYNTLNSNLMVNNLPCVNYGGVNVKRENIYWFFRELLKFNEDENFKSGLIEKVILYDLQVCLNYFNYCHSYEKTKYIWKFFKFLYQPLRVFKTNSNDKNMLREITKSVGISSVYEALESVKNIFEKIENYLKDSSINEHYFTCMEILIYSAVKTVNRVISRNKIKTYQLNSFTYINKLSTALDNFIANQKVIKRDVLAPAEFEIPKFIHINNSFKKYLDIPVETEEEKKRTLIRKSVLSASFFMILVILKLTIRK
jgi:hypothetical protein